MIHDLEDNFKQNNILKLKQLFPEVFCEDQIDFEKLKLVLGAENLAGAGERYQLDWAGKTASYLNLQSPTSRTLVPCKEESADFDGTQNVFIEAENLEALKILQKSYAGSVKMIYIDPPYNTGSDSFIYPDKFSESREEYARRVGDTDDAGYLKRDGVFQGAWRKNGKDSGHYHSNWLSMMLPRLHLAKTLLREDGVIFISIDDNEQAQLKLLCDEVFGAENFVSQISWHRKRGKDNSAPNLSRVHEYLFVYAKNIENLRFNKLEIEAETLKAYKNPDNDERGDYRVLGLWARGNQGGSRYEYTTLNGRFYSEREWLVGLENMKKLDEEKRLIENGDKLYRKLFLSEVAGSVPETIWLDTSNTANAADELKKIFDKKAYFDTPKPIPYLLKMAKLATNSDDLILDFFSGSGTTAHAVMQLNAEDGGSRRFICVQLPEETDEKSEARKAGFDTIAEIAKERIRRAGRQISDGLQSGQNVDTGFKVFKLAESGFKQWRQSGQADTEALQGELSLNIDSVLSETPSENLLCELMLRLGLKLTCKVSLSDGVYFVEDEDTGGLYAFLLERVNQDLIDAVLAKHPVKAVVLDRLFEGDDALKGNTVLQMKDAGVMFECV
ncbi:site-specific DNA-methyltransferase [Neisseria meningitidis]|nr:site-specific DNA-methyltransferase [Neisseria meningitidis]MBH2013006.1 site-specific DNA-methyltransferase [Neisseria meningitidis]MBH2022231.1 site-specific DNA-methyltransferase [Neisseria meningitidis]MBH2052427.1 site-specific DNA-methyltransferase [Neisseria meningitidis]MBH2054532.1 site-specific DNA-methyltransferase [Neisseria meningitidis]